MQKEEQAVSWQKKSSDRCRFDRRGWSFHATEYKINIVGKEM